MEEVGLLPSATRKPSPLPDVAVLHGDNPAVGLRELAKASRGLCRLTFVYDPEGKVDRNHRRLLESIGNVLEAPRHAWPEHIRDLGIDGVTTFDDQHVDDLELILQVTKLPGSSGGGVWDKFQQRVLLNEAGASSLKVIRIESNDQLSPALQAMARPCICKPVRGSTSRGIQVFPGASWLRTEQAPTALLCEGAHVLEELMDASEEDARLGLAPFVSVETVSGASKRHHFAMTDKLPLVGGYLETGDITPSGLPSTTQARVLQVVDAALGALGVQNRVTHTEVRLTSRGPQVIEVNGRLGGYVHGLLARTTGLDPTALALRVALGMSVASVPDLRDQEPVGAALALTVPLRGAGETEARDVLALLRGDPVVRAVEMSFPVSGGFRTVGAWLQNDQKPALFRDLAGLAMRLIDSPRASYVDEAWLRELGGLPELI